MRSKILPTLVALSTLCAGLSAGHAGYIGNTLQANNSTDGDPPLVILGGYNSTAPTATSTIKFPSAGMVTNVQTYDNAAGDHFNAYLLQPAGTDGSGNQQFTVIDSSPTLTTTAPGGGGVDTYTLSTPWSAAPGDLLAFWGQGPLYTNGTGADATYQTTGGTQYFATAPTLGDTYSFGAVANNTAIYQYLPGGNAERVYAIGVNFVPTPEPSSIVLCGLAAVGLFTLIRRKRRV